MKNTPQTSLLIMLMGFQLMYYTSCTYDVADPCHTTYNSEVQTIMLKSCAYAGCHSGASASPYVPAEAKDYTTYEGMMATVENGKFKERAIELQNMPPAAFIPADKPASLTGDEIKTLQCWLDQGYPEK
jgi:hypothetical protein